MSTRATIAVRRPSGDYLATYLHFDGYPEHAGRLLEEHFLNAEQVEALVDRGDIRFLHSEIGDPEYYDNGDSPAKLPTRDALVDYAKNLGARYLYVFDDAAWSCLEL